MTGPGQCRATAAAPRRATLLACLLLSALLGTIHAFSLFLEPLEARFAASRSAVSLTYSFALIALTLGVLGGHRLYRALPAPGLVLLICAAAAGGAALAAVAPSLAVLWLGYSLLFGFANGLGYGFVLHVAGQSSEGREGTAMGLATAFYAAGAAAAPPLIGPLLAAQGAAGGFETSMFLLAAALLAAGLVAAAALRWAGFVFLREEPGGAPGKGGLPDPAAHPDRSGGRTVALLWLGYGSAVTAGLMAIGHATGIARAAGLADAAVLAAPAAIALANMAGGFAGGLLLDRMATARLLSALPAVSLAALLALALAPGEAMTLPGLACVGFAYGAIIAAYPAAIVRRFGAGPAVRLYGYVFTAWGVAGFLGPWLGGAVFDASGSYRLALGLAAVLALVSTLTVLAGRRRLA